eukprot:CAMPEP_0185018998 /NCGR_PEP_ID=MMETSP1103-20130426/1632_1 /TAXON_ID=36769 /ORGANISM="Paraphysomonas bandaiensis, Strain Caron Lab Isolate" /LENGTH=580 /DNA_ID=CAMNT_0027549065 /DNA_START=258 /DNA_END=2000 /DNA_ORIENTATION=+
MTIIGFIALGIIHSDKINEGNPERLLRGVDYKGKICGVDNPVKDLEKKWEPNNILSPDYDPSYSEEYGFCVSSCPKEGETRVNPYDPSEEWDSPWDTVNILGYCIPVIENRQTNIAQDTFGDFIRVAGLIAVTGFVLAVVMCYVYLFFLRIPCMLTIIVWSNVIIIEAFLVAGAILMLNKAYKENEAQSDDPEAFSDMQINLLRGIGGLLAGLAVVWVCVVCFLRERIQLAIDLIQEAAACVTSLTAVPLFCLCQVLCFCGFSVLWLLYTVYLVSSAEVTTEPDGAGVAEKELEYSERAKQAVVFMVFMWLWTTAFIEAFGQISFAHACLEWYFAENRDSVSHFQIFKSSAVVARYHCGTAAFGSLILAVIQMIRYVLTYIKEKFSDPNNRFHQCVLKCMFCCIHCLEECIKFINKHAYIQCAMEGKGFLPSAVRAFGLIMRNIARVSVVTLIGNLTVVIGKLCVTLVCSGLAYLYMDRYLEDQLNGFILPTIFVGFIAWLTASMFLDILIITADTLLQGFLIEEEFERNAKKGRGITRERSHAQKSVRSVLDKTQSFKEGKYAKANIFDPDLQQDNSEL